MMNKRKRKKIALFMMAWFIIFWVVLSIPELDTVWIIIGSTAFWAIALAIIFEDFPKN